MQHLNITIQIYILGAENKPKAYIISSPVNWIIHLTTSTSYPFNFYTSSY